MPLGLLLYVCDILLKNVHYRFSVEGLKLLGICLVFIGGVEKSILSGRKPIGGFRYLVYSFRRHFTIQHTVYVELQKWEAEKLVAFATVSVFL